jgi:hypothetical protein
MPDRRPEWSNDGHIASPASHGVGNGGDSPASAEVPPAPDARTAPRRNAKSSNGETALAGADRVFRDLSEAIAAEVARKAMAGDTAAARLVFDRLAAGDRERRLDFDLRRIETAKDAVSAMGDVLRALSTGRLTLGEADCVVRMLRTLAEAHRFT